MKQRISSFHVTRWLRVLAIAGVVLASSSATVAKDETTSPEQASSARTSSWCPRC